MDSIDSLPTIENSDFTPDEESVLNTYFSDDDDDTSINSKFNWKFFIIVLIVFALLCSSILNGVLNKVPYVSKNEYTLLLFKTILFALVYLGLYYFM